MNNRLKPCPFCGVRPVVRKCWFDDKGFVINHDMLKKGALECPIADWGEKSMVGGTVYETRLEAINEWNNRRSEGINKPRRKESALRGKCSPGKT